MKEFECGKCGSSDVYIKENGSQVGLYCGDCGRWLKWVGKEERRLVERYIKDNKSNKTATATIQPELTKVISEKDRLVLLIIKELAKFRTNEHMDKLIDEFENVLYKY